MLGAEVVQEHCATHCCSVSFLKSLAMALRNYCTSNGIWPKGEEFRAAWLCQQPLLGISELIPVRDKVTGRLSECSLKTQRQLWVALLVAECVLHGRRSNAVTVDKLISAGRQWPCQGQGQRLAARPEQTLHWRQGVIQLLAGTWDLKVGRTHVDVPIWHYLVCYSVLIHPHDIFGLYSQLVHTSYFSASSVLYHWRAAISKTAFTNYSVIYCNFF